MPSERVQRRIDRLLDQIDEAEAAGDWQTVSDLSQDVLDSDPYNEEAQVYLKAAQRRVGAATATAEPITEPTGPAKETDTPTSFSSGRYNRLQDAW